LPDITVELIRNAADPGGVSELAVPPVAPRHRQRAAGGDRRALPPPAAALGRRMILARETSVPVADRPIGVLLVNLGTPDAPEAGAVRRYLGEFLSDRRVIEIPRIVWKPILHGIILRTRPKIGACLWAGVARGRIAARRDHPRAGGGAGGRVRARRDRRSCDALRQAGDRRADRARSRTRAASASCSRRSIRNIARRRPRPPTTPPSPRWRRCAGSRRSARCRPIMTIRPISPH
jgi:hypothetical protein